MVPPRVVSTYISNTIFHPFNSKRRRGMQPLQWYWKRYNNLYWFTEIIIIYTPSQGPKCPILTRVWIYIVLNQCNTSRFKNLPSKLGRRRVLTLNDQRPDRFHNILTMIVWWAQKTPTQKYLRANLWAKMAIFDPFLTYIFSKSFLIFQGSHRSEKVASIGKFLKHFTKFSQSSWSGHRKKPK